ncbi:hypothetical protein SPRA44_220083 [Serratia proteamaculans]|nr:hypothetical protein SPRA44_220083 [Serratia proteamaculans]
MHTLLTTEVSVINNVNPVKILTPL